MKRVLIVDDNEENRYLLRILLESNGWSVDEADNGVKALEKAHTEIPDLIISDLLMPEMDGYTLLKYWKSDRIFKPIPFIVYTATYTEPKDEQLALDLGADMFILKPTEPEIFMDKINEMIKSADGGDLMPPKEPATGEVDQLKKYSEILIHQLEKKTRELEKVNLRLQTELAERKQTEIKIRQLLNDSEKSRYDLEKALGENKSAQQQISFQANILTQVQDAIIATDLENNILYWNKTAQDMYGWSAEEVMNRPLDGVIHKKYLFPVSENIIFSRLDLDDSWMGEVNHQKKDGTYFPVSSIISQIKDKGGTRIGYIEANRDITEIKKFEKALENAEKKYRSIFEKATQGIFQSTREGKFLDVNPAFARMLGYGSPEELILSISNIKDQLFVDPDQRNKLERQLEKENIINNFEFQMYCKNGVPIWVKESIHTVRGEGGNILFYEGTIENISEIKAAEKKKKSLEAQLVQAQKLESLGTLASGIAHDFNNILGIIMGHSSILQQSPLPSEEYDTSIEAIKQAAVRGEALVKQLLTFARKSDIQLQSVSVNNVIEEIIKLLNEIFPKSIEIKTELEKNLPLISADPSRIHQVLLNLCVNARDAMPQGGRLLISSGTVSGRELSTRFPEAANSRYINIIVTDSGIGMDESIKQRIFEPFFTTKGIGKGTGLGLSLIYGVIEQHRGFIGVTSEPDKGTTFNLYFPVENQSRKEKPLTNQSMKDVIGGSETILLVDDEKMLRDLLKNVLQSKGYKVLTAKDGEDGLKTYSQYRDEIDLVITDLGLPKFSGDELYKRLKKIRSDVKAIIVSGFIDPQIKTRIMEKGVNSFIQKPYKFQDILKTIRDIIDFGMEKG